MICRHCCEPIRYCHQGRHGECKGYIHEDGFHVCDPERIDHYPLPFAELGEVFA